MAEMGEGRESRRLGEGWGGGEELTAVMKGEVPPKLASGGRRHPAHLFGLSVLRWVVVGGQSGGGGRAGGRGAIFLESFVCGGVHTRAVCVCACVSGSSGGGVQAVCVCVCAVCARATVSPG